MAPVPGAAAALAATPLDLVGGETAEVAFPGAAGGGTAATAGRQGGVFGRLFAIGLAMVRAGGDSRPAAVFSDRAGISASAGNNGGGEDAGSSLGSSGGVNGGASGSLTLLMDTSGVVMVMLGEKPVAVAQTGVVAIVEGVSGPVAIREPLHLTGQTEAVAVAPFLGIEVLAFMTESAIKFARADFAATI